MKVPSRIVAALTAPAVLIAVGFAITMDAQALPSGVHCVSATAANELTPPPPLWEQKHEPRPKNLPKPLCPAGSVPTTVPGASGSTSVTAAPPVTASPKQTADIEPLTAGLPPTSQIEPPKEVTGYPTAPYYYAGDGYLTPEPWYGVSFGIQVGNPTLSGSSGGHSLGQVTAATPSIEYTAEFGWHRDEGFGAGSRLFTYINKDHYKTNGEPGGDCYNCITPQVGAPYTQNQELTVGTTYQFTVEYTGGSWWFAVGPSWIGHENGSFWGGKFTSSTWLTVHGEVYDSSGPKTQMGNGTIGTAPGSLVMNNPYLYKEKGELFTTKGHANKEKDPYPNDVPGYNVGRYSTNEREWHYGGE